MKVRNFLMVISLFPFHLMAQDIRYARLLVDTLTSPGMDGRGYVNDGDKKAADFIASEYTKFKLDSFGRGYFQPFQFDVNTFPENIEVKINKKVILPGVDYIVDPASGKGKGNFEWISVITSPEQTSENEVKNKIVVIDKARANSKEEIENLNKWTENTRGAAGIIYIEEKKLTWSVSSYQRQIPVVHILKQAWPDDPREISIRIDAHLNENHKSNNIIGFIKGEQVSDTFLVFSAHYDHLGRMGKETYFPGANDNASGMAMLLNLIQYYSRPENKPKYSHVFISFAGEEAGLLGSQYYTSNPLFPLSKIKFLLNMDLLGTGDDGLMVVNGDVYKPEYDFITAINNEHKYLKFIGKRGKARNSDHYYFSEKGVPCFFFYTLGGISAYHDIYDKGETLPFTEFEDVFRLIRDFEFKISE